MDKFITNYLDTIKKYNSPLSFAQYPNNNVTFASLCCILVEKMVLYAMVFRLKKE